MRRSPSISICRAEVLDVGYAAHVQHQHARLVLRDQGLDLLPHRLRIDEEQPPFRAQDQQAFEGLVVAVFGRQRSQHVLATLAADDVHARVRGLAGQADHRHDDRHHDALEGAQQQDADAGDQGPAEFHRAHAADGTELRRLDQPDRVDDDHRGQRRIGHQAKDRRQEQHGGERGARGHQRGQLRLPAGGAHDRRLRSSAAGRHDAEQGAAKVRRAGGEQFPVRVDRRIVGAREGAPGRDRLGEAHQGDSERTRQQPFDQRRIRQGQRREALRDQADDRDAHLLQPEEPGRGDAARHRDQRGRRARPQPFHRDQHREGREGDHQRDRRGFGHVVDDADGIEEEAVLGDVDAQQLGHLVEHDHQPDAGLESGKHRRRYEVGDEAESQEPRRDQRGADQQGQRRRRRHEARRIAVRHRQSQLRAGEDRDGRGRADAEHARGAEQRVDRHRDESGIQADRNRQAGHRRVSHRLGKDDRGGGQPGHQVEAEGRRLRRARLGGNRSWGHRVCSWWPGCANRGTGPGRWQGRTPRPRVSFRPPPCGPGLRAIRARPERSGARWPRRTRRAERRIRSAGVIRPGPVGSSPGWVDETRNSCIGARERSETLGATENVDVESEHEGQLTIIVGIWWRGY